MAQPTEQEIKQQWESIGDEYVPPFHQVNYTVPRLAKWAYERGVNDTQKTCEQHQDAAHVARQNAIAQRDAARSELAFVRRDRDMAEGQVVNQREAIASLNRQIAAGARELNQKADTIRTLNAQLVEAQKRAEALKEDLKFERENNAVREAFRAPLPRSYQAAWVAVCQVLHEVTPNWLSFPAEDAAVKAIKGLKKDLDEANKDFDELYEVVKGKQATIDAMNDLENKTIKSLRKSLDDCIRRNNWQAEELNRMAKKFCGRPWNQTLSV